MKQALLLVLIAAASARGQDGAIRRGERLFRAHCATAYCHGPEGAAGRAPRLIGQHYNVNAMFKIITWGIPGTGMPEFTTRLKTEEIADLVGYVMSLGGPAAPVLTPATPARVLTPQARQGRALFFDSARTSACGSCHELDGWGVPVGPDLAALPPDRYANLRAVATRRIMTASPRGGERPFPALLVEHTDSRVRVYDLTAPLPVLRSFNASDIALEPGTSWRHEHSMRPYTGAELEAIAAFLRWRAQ